MSYYKNNIWEYNTKLNSWNKKAELSQPRAGGYYFTFGSFGYYTDSGTNNHTGSSTFSTDRENDLFRYNPDVDNWEQIDDFPFYFCHGGNGILGSFYSNNDAVGIALVGDINYQRITALFTNEDISEHTILAHFPVEDNYDAWITSSIQINDITYIRHADKFSMFNPKDTTLKLVNTHSLSTNVCFVLNNTGYFLDIISGEFWTFHPQFIIESPINLQANAISKNAIELTWEADTSDGYYLIEKRLYDTVAYEEIGTTQSSNFTDSTLKPSQLAYYKVRKITLTSSSLYNYTSATSLDSTIINETAISHVSYPQREVLIYPNPGRGFYNLCNK
jgi:hypothetical protein